MGLLTHFDLSGFPADCFVETGTQHGDGLEYARQGGSFKELHSIEMSDAYYQIACARFALYGKDIHLWHGTSEEKLPEVLKAIEHHDSALFWLDAHLPEDGVEDFLTRGTGSKANVTNNDEESSHDTDTPPPIESIEFPLKRELQLIVDSRNTRNDFFLIDDLRIYIEGNFQYPFNSHPQHHHYKQKYPNYFPHPEGITFIEELLEETHHLMKIWDHEGYLLAAPKIYGMGHLERKT